MGVFSGAAISGAIILAVYYLQLQFSHWLSAKKNKCEPPPKRKSNSVISKIYNNIRGVKPASPLNDLPAGVILHAENGNTFREKSRFGITSLRTRDVSNIHTVFGLNAADWGVEPFRLAAMKPFMGEGFITKDGPVWERSRALLKPSFHKNNISDLNAFESSLNILLSKLPVDGSTVDLQLLLLLMFVDTSTHFILGKSVGVLNSGESAGNSAQGMAFLKSFQLSLRGCGMRLAMGPLRVLAPKSATSDHWQAVHKAVEHYITDTLENKYQDSDGRQSLLGSVAQQTKDLVEIRDQIIQGMTASQDTTPLLISNSVFLLSRNPAVWQRLRNEVANAGSGPLTLEDTRKFKLLRNILNESLRLYPVFPLLARVALKNTILPVGGGSGGKSPVYAAAGTMILSDFYALHRDETIYGPNVEKFNPDRWDTIKPGPWEYMGFGGGSRACLGQHKALAEASCTLIRLAQAYSRIESRDDRDWTGDQKLVARNANGCKVALIPA